MGISGTADNHVLHAGFYYSTSTNDVATDAGIMYASSTNNGTTWTQEVVGLPTGFARSPSSMLVKNDSVYISSNAGIYATVSSGTISWNLINTNPSGLVFTKLFASGSDIFAITTKGVYKSGDNTANWVPSHDEMRGLITTKIYSAGGTDLFATTLWGVGDGYFYRSSDFGNTWVMGNKIGSPYLFNNFLLCYLISQN